MNKVTESISNGIVYIIRMLHTLNEMVPSSARSKNPNAYDDLAPIDNADKDNKYSEAIEWALSNEKIKNIAITGPFGSGKSSVLRTFEKNHKEYDYLNISLGTFKDDLEKSSTDESQNTLIEKSILQQIFYRVRDRKIPYSRFARISNDNFFTYILYSILIVIWVFAGLYVYKHQDSLEIQILYTLNRTSYLLQSSVAILILGLVIIVNKALRIFKHSRLNEISFSSGKLKFDESSNSSILNKHLDEILYFFERTKFNVVVIEDLDRFDEVGIFIKLRELNTLINNSDQIRRKIVFIYAIRDEVFTETNRTKFFDFIVPVIPVINASNSGEILFKKLSNNSLISSISRSFISDITLFIDDMRMLKNIYNEFEIYNEKLGTIGEINLPQDKLLAFIVYKNKYPQDFAELNSNRGLVAEIFNNKRKIVREFVSKKEAERLQITSELEEIDRQFLSSVQELRTGYLGALSIVFPGATGIQLQSGRIGIAQLREDAAFDQFKSAPNITVVNQYNANLGTVTFKQLESTLGSELSYDKKLQLITSKIKGRIEEIKSQIQKLTRDLQEANSWSIKELLEVPDIESPFADKRFSEAKLLVYLIRNGYIDEMYHAFISYFYEGNLTTQDMAFILSVKNQEALDFTYPLVNCEEIIRKLNRVDFMRGACLNFDLLAALFSNPLHKDNLGLMLELLCNSKEALTFIDAFIAKKEFEDKLIFKLSKMWPEFWTHILQEPGYSNDKINNYLKLIIRHVDIPDILMMNVDSSLSTYISESRDFLKLMSEIRNPQKVQKTISSLGVKLTSIAKPDSNEELFKYVLANNLYEINEETIGSILKRNAPELDNSGALKSANYTAILASNCVPLIKYVHDEIDLYLTDVFLRIDTNSKESESSVIALLNNESLDESNKAMVLRKEEAVIANLSKVQDSQLWDVMFSLGRVRASWDNLLTYYSENKKLSDEVIGFLNQEPNYVELVSAPIEMDEEHKDLVDDLYMSIIQCNELSDDSFSQLMKIIPFASDELDIEKISDSHMQPIIDNHILNLTPKNYVNVHAKCEHECAHWIELNIGEFIRDIKSYELNVNELMFLLNSENVSNANKTIIINSISEVKFQESDDFVEAVYSLVLNNSEPVELSPECLNILLKQGVKLTLKIRLLSSQIDRLESPIVISLISLLGQDVAVILNNQQLLLDDNIVNRVFAEKLVSKGIVSSVKDDNNKLRFYPKRITG